MFVRWNQLSQVWEYDSSGGLGAGPWILLPNLSYLNKENTFTAPARKQTISSDYPYLLFKSSTAPAGSQSIRLEGFGTEFWISFVDDNDSGYIRRFRFGREGNFSIDGSIIEHGRSYGMGDWIAYTPLWTSTGTQPSIGNGTLVGKYTLIGTTCHFSGRFVPGSTSTFGSGTWLFGLPIAPGPVNSYIIGSAMLQDITPYKAYNLSVVPSGNKFYVQADTGQVSLNIPFTWVSGDALDFCGTYSIA